MKIFTVTTDDENGTQVQVFLNEEKQLDAVSGWMDYYWEEYMGDMPVSIPDALDQYQNRNDNENYIWAETHEVSEQIKVLAAYGCEVVEEVMHGEKDLKVLNKLEGTADILTFDTKAEAQAYLKGSEEADGWNNQWVETL